MILFSLKERIYGAFIAVLRLPTILKDQTAVWSEKLD